MKAKSIKYFYIYNFFSSFLLFLPVLLMIYNKRNISASDMLIIEAFYYFSIFLFEVPTGFLGDRIGHDKLVIIGLIGTVLSYIVFSVSFSSPTIILSQVLLGLFGSCISGSDQSSLYTYIEKKDNLNHQNKIYRLSMASMLISFILSGFVLKIDAQGKLTFLLTAIAYTIATTFYVLFVVSKSDHKNGSVRTQVEKDKKACASIDLFNKDVIICGILFGILLGSYVVSQIFYNNLKISPYMIGVLYCLGTISTIFLNKLDFKFNKKIMFLMPLMYLVTIINNKITVLLFIFIISLIKSKVKPFINNYVLTHSKDNKAYNMSLMSLIYNVINVILMVSLSTVIKLMGYNIAMIFISILTLILITYIYNKSSDEYKLELNRAG